MRLSLAGSKTTCIGRRNTTSGATRCSFSFGIGTGLAALVACIADFAAGAVVTGAASDGGADGNAATASEAVAAMSEATAMVRLLIMEFRDLDRIDPNSSPARCVRPVHPRSGLLNIPWYRVPMITVGTSLLAAIMATDTVAPPASEADFV